MAKPPCLHFFLSFSLSMPQSYHRTHRCSETTLGSLVKPHVAESNGPLVVLIVLVLSSSWQLLSDSSWKAFLTWLPGHQLRCRFPSCLPCSSSFFLQSFSKSRGALERSPWILLPLYTHCLGWRHSLIPEPQMSPESRQLRDLSSDLQTNTPNCLPNISDSVCPQPNSPPAILG